MTAAASSMNSSNCEEVMVTKDRRRVSTCDKVKLHRQLCNLRKLACVTCFCEVMATAKCKSSGSIPKTARLKINQL